MARTSNLDIGLSQQFTRHGLRTLAIRPFGMAATLGMHLYLARELGVAGYGQWASMIAVLSCLLPFAKLGWENALLHSVPKYVLQDKSGLLVAVSGQVRNSLILTSALLATLAFYFLRQYRYSAHDIHWFTIFLWLLGIGLVEVFTTAFLGLKFISFSQIARELVRPLGVVLSLAGLSYLFEVPLTAGVAISTGAVVSFAWGAALFLGFRWAVTSSTDDEPAPPFSWRANCSSFWAVSVMIMVLEHADLVILGWFAADESLGKFAVSAKLASYVPLVFVTASNAVAPLFVEADHDSNADPWRLFRRVTVVGTLGAIPLACLLLFATKPIVGMFGHDFGGQETVLYLLVLAQLIRVVSGPGQLFLMMCGHAKRVASLLAVATVLSLTLATVGSYLGGANGLAYGVVVGSIFRHGGMLVAARYARHEDYKQPLTPTD